MFSQYDSDWDNCIVVLVCAECAQDICVDVMVPLGFGRVMLLL